jgi:hypothetical protein
MTSPPEKTQPKTDRGGNMRFVVGFVVALVAADHLAGPLLPDDVYCALGAGTVLQVAGRSEPSAWSANNGCGAYRPECVPGWSTTPASASCVHTTLWDAMKAKAEAVARRLDAGS